MKVLVVTPNYPPAVGGIENLLSNLVTRWTRVQPTVLTFRPGVKAANVRRISRIGGHQASVALLNAATIAAGLRLRPRVIVSGHIVTSPGALLLSRLVGAPVLQYLYGREIPRRQRLAAFAIRRADVNVAISEYTERLARAAFAGAVLVRIPPGIDLPATNAAREKAQRIVSVGRLAERSKGHDILLTAFELVRAQVPAARLTIVGDGPLRPELERRARELRIAGDVHFTGRVSDQERDDLLRSASVFALPTREDPDGGGEGFGIVFLEAAAHGLPVVAGAAGGTVDAVVDGETGIVVDGRDARSVAAGIVRLLEDADLADRYGRAGAERAASFTWDEVARRVEDVVLELAER